MRKELIVMKMRGKGEPWFCRVGRGLWYVRNLSKAGVARPGSPPVLLWPMSEGWFVHLSSCHLKVMGTLNCDVTRSCCVGRMALSLTSPFLSFPDAGVTAQKATRLAVMKFFFFFKDLFIF